MTSVRKQVGGVPHQQTDFVNRLSTPSLRPVEVLIFLFKSEYASSQERPLTMQCPEIFIKFQNAEVVLKWPNIQKDGQVV